MEEITTVEKEKNKLLKDIEDLNNKNGDLNKEFKLFEEVYKLI